MEKKFEFDQKYLDYFKGAVQKSLDGTVVPGLEVCDHYVKLMQINAGDRLLDLGCSYGRLFPVFARYTNQVFGADVDLQVVNEAIKTPYILAIVGQAEKLAFPSQFFDHVVAWGVFDIVDQLEALKETNRILKTGGKFLFTAKGSQYHEADDLAFVAERNAKLKNFPNRFIDLGLLTAALPALGFEIEQKYHFARRGHLGLNQTISGADEIKTNRCYEFAAILKKIADPDGQPVKQWWSEFSQTAMKKAAAEGFTNDPLDFFQHSFNKQKS